MIRFVLWALIVAKLIGGWGVQWDIEWHVRVGRDTFWIPPHVMTYAGVTLTVLLCWGMLAWYTLRGDRSPDVIRIFGIAGTRGFHLAAWGVAVTVLAAPIDDLWHRLFGLDVTLWSPPHLLGILGGLINSMGCLVIAREAYPANRLARVVTLVLVAASLYRGLALVTQPAYLFGYHYGGVWFHAPAIFAALLLPFALIPAARLTDLRSGPVMVLVVVALTVAVGQSISDKGFALLQPVSVMAEEVAKDPTSSIALAYAISRKSGGAPGRSSLEPVIASLLAAGAMAAVDARRRPVAAALAYALVMFVLSGWMLSYSTVFGPMAPGLGTTLAALALAVSAAVVAGRGGGAVARALGSEP
jgi:hypothetical protein